MSARSRITAADIGSIGGHARAASLSPDRRRQIARQAALARWHAERRDYWRKWPIMRMSLAEFNAIPIGKQPNIAALYRIIEQPTGRWCVVVPAEPHVEPAVGLKMRPVIRVPAVMRPVSRTPGGTPMTKSRLPQKRGRKRNEPRLAAIIAAWRENPCPPEIAAAFDVTLSLLWFYRRRYERETGEILPAARTKTGSVRAARNGVERDEAAIIAAYRGGATLRAIGAEHGMAHTRVQALLAKNGVTRRSTGRVAKHPVAWVCPHCGTKFREGQKLPSASQREAAE